MVVVIVVAAATVVVTCLIHLGNLKCILYLHDSHLVATDFIGFGIDR